MGMTDIDDKIIKRAHDDGTHFLTVSRRFEREFLADLQRLNV